VVVGFGTISLAADMVYEGGRSLYGPLLSSLGASALAVGAITGAGEAVALLLRLGSGVLADRSRRYWTVTIAGYALTAVCVPLLAVTPYLGAAGLAVATVLILAERTGKAIRSPAKSALLAAAAQHVGMGRGLGVHKALDQIGAFAGPLLVAGVVALAGAVLWPGFAVLAIPGAVAMVLLVLTRHRMPAEQPTARAPAGIRMGDLPPAFWLFAVASAVCTAGLVTFGLISFHLVEGGIVPAAGAPLLYAAAMAAGAVAALLTGEAYDRVGPRTLLALPVLVAAVPPLAFAGGLAAVTAGVLLWGAAVGLQDSTVKALVADLVRPERRATAYGLFAAVQGVGALAGGIATGALYEHSTWSLVIAVAASQTVAAALLGTLAGRPHHPGR
jgi:MFS family permease